MQHTLRFLVAALIVATISVAALAQEPKLTPQQNTEVELAFDTANKLLEQGKHAEALTHYKKALALLPKEPAILFNAGMAAFGSKDFNTAVDLWKQLKQLEPSDWHLRAKLIQAYQALEKPPSETPSEQSCLPCGTKASPLSSNSSINTAASSLK